MDHPCHQNDQYWSLFVEWIIKNPIFLLILALFLSEAVEASRCHFFENWWMKLKCPLLLKPLATIVQQNYQSFSPSEPFRIIKYQVEFWQPFMLEAVEASRCHFFENWLMKLKFPHLLKPLATIIQQNHWFFYPSGPFSYDHFNTIHPVQGVY